MIWFDFPKIGELAIAMFTSLAHGHFNLDTSPTYEIGQAASNSPSSTLLESRFMGGIHHGKPSLRPLGPFDERLC